MSLFRGPTRIAPHHGLASDPVTALDKALGGHLPAAALAVLGILIAAGAVLGQLHWMAAPLKWLASRFGKSKTPADERQFIARRRKFAKHLAAQIERLNQKEEWRDDRFAELEAEVEAEGQVRRSLRVLRRRGLSGGDSLRRERSLALALETSSERLILVTGDPGAGKTVALRHVALTFATRSAASSSHVSQMPVYVNLKGFHPANHRVTADEVRHYIKADLKKVNDRDVVRFVDANFDRILEEGGWFFLFDSFDEIPEVLSATDADSTVRRYSDAIYDFLNGVHECRGVIASRNWRAPKETGWVRFRIVRLSWERQMRLIKKSDLDVKEEELLLSELPTAPYEIRGIADNPLFLGLLCDYVRQNADFPTNSHAVFDAYVERRLHRDEEQVIARYQITAGRVGAVAENVAFAMATSNDLGLIASPHQIAEEFERMQFDPSDLDAGLKALAYVKLLRDEDSGSDSEPAVTFSHRRFQEYFATRLVLRAPGLVDSKTLLTDGRWRETAVTILQAQPLKLVEPLVAEATRLAARYAKKMSATSSPSITGEAWPHGSLHLLGLIDAGLGARSDIEAVELRNHIDAMVTLASDGQIWDRKWALEVSGAASQERLQITLTEAFESGSAWLRGVAYRQVGRLHVLPNEIADSIRRTLVTLAAEGRIRRDRMTIDAQLRRMDRPEHFLKVSRLLRSLPIIDAVILAVLLTMLASVWKDFGPTLLMSLFFVGFSEALSLRLLTWFAAWTKPEYYRRFFDFLGTTRTEGMLVAYSYIGSRMFALFFTFLAVVRSAPGYTPPRPSVQGFLEGELGPHVLPPAILILGVAWCFYPIGALAAARSGRFTHWSLWCLHPVLPVVFGARWCLGRMRRARRRDYLALASALALFIVVAGLFAGLTWLFITRAQTVGLVLAVLSFAAMTLFGIWVTSRRIARETRDRRALRSARENLAAEFDAEEFWKVIFSIESPVRVAQLIDSMRLNAACVADARIAMALQAFAGVLTDQQDFDADQSPESPGDSDPPGPTFADRVHSWKGFDACLRRPDFRSDLIDALGRYIEASRQGR